ncbi:MAG: AAA family ATPase [Gemmataceae bacterium]
MIKSLKVKNLNGHMNFDLKFHEDINLITGKNGSGKTTILKLIWYAISGNLERLIQEIKFESFELETDRVSISMQVELGTKPKLHLLRRSFRLQYSLPAAEPLELSIKAHDPSSYDALIEANRSISVASGSSICFPTFRRIEGGFSIGSLSTPTRTGSYDQPSRLPQAMAELSELLSVGNHHLVTSTSVDDIVRLITAKYAELSERSHKMQLDISKTILRDFGSASTDEHLKQIQQHAQQIEKEREQLFQPFTTLLKLIEKIFQYRGIELPGLVSLGEAQEAIASEVLSAGEKQMLSFLCYNAFRSPSTIFIDEPEISLHVDWQRVLFPTLLRQSTGNQFIVATHSPFIYAKYPDKDLVLADRGDADADPAPDRRRTSRNIEEDFPTDVAGGRPG